MLRLSGSCRKGHCWRNLCSSSSRKEEECCWGMVQLSMRLKQWIHWVVDSTHAIPRLGSPASSLGIGPVRRLWSRCLPTTVLKKNIHARSVLCVLLVEQNRTEQYVTTIHSRTTYRNVKDLASPSAAGIAPEMLLLDTSRLNSFSSCPSSGARVPDKFRFPRSLSNEDAV